MVEGLEAGAAVVGTHPAGADPVGDDGTKWFNTEPTTSTLEVPSPNLREGVGS